ncbi:uncharacterized protein LOC143248960 isoform X2 [Tachypleus tridentatus]
MQSYIGKKNERKKKELQKSLKTWSRPSSAVEFESHQHSQDLHESQERDKTEDLKVERNIKSPVSSSQKSSVADKISWYLEALDQGVFTKTWPGNSPFSSSRLVHTNSQLSLSTSFDSFQRKQRDLLDSHIDKFTFQKNPFKPCLLKNNHAQSKLHTMRCYNPPRRIKSIHAQNKLVVAAERPDENKLDDKWETVAEEWLHDQARRAQARQKIFWVLDHQAEDPSVDSAFNETPQGKTTISSSPVERYGEEEYVAFVKDVTEDILKKGVYSNRGIKKLCQFHIQQKSKDLDKEKMQELLDQLLSHLCISSDDSFDDVDFGFGSSSCSKNNLKWCIPLERKEEFNGDETLCFQLEEHSKLNVEESFCQSGRSKENSFAEDSDQENSDHSLSNQNSNVGNILTEENKSYDTVASSPCSSDSKHVPSRTSTVNDKYSSSVYSDNFTSHVS